MTIRIDLATEDRWSDVVSAFGRAGTNPSSCWCQRFLDHDRGSNQDALRREIAQATVPIGLIAYDDGRPVGWSRAAPRRSLPGVTGNRALARLLDDDDSAWWVSCVNLQPRARGKGIGVALLAAAVEHAREHGASVIDGHPVDVAMSARRPSPSALFTGTVSMFSAAGFEEIGRTYPSRPVMRMPLR